MEGGVNGAIKQAGHGPRGAKKKAESTAAATIVKGSEREGCHRLFLRASIPFQSHSMWSCAHAGAERVSLETDLASFGLVSSSLLLSFCEGASGVAVCVFLQCCGAGNGILTKFQRV